MVSLMVNLTVSLMVSLMEQSDGQSHGQSDGQSDGQSAFSKTWRWRWRVSLVVRWRSQNTMGALPCRHQLLQHPLQSLRHRHRGHNSQLPAVACQHAWLAYEHLHPRHSGGEQREVSEHRVKVE